MSIQNGQQRYNRSGKQARRHFYCLLFSGIVLSAVLLAVSIASVANQIYWITHVGQKGSASSAIEKFDSITTNLYTELDLRINDSGNTEAIEVAHNEWITSIDSLQDSFSAERLSTLYGVIHDFNDSTTAGRLLFNYVQIVLFVSAFIFELLKTSSYASRAIATADSLVLYSTQAAIGSLLARISFFLSKDATFELGADDGFGIAMQYVTATFAPLYSTDSIKLANEYGDDVHNAYSLYRESISFQSSTKTINFQSLATLEQYTSYLEHVADVEADVINRTPIYYFAACFILIAVALVLCCIIFCRYAKKTRTARQLLSAFENQRTREHLHEQYLPVLQDLRAVSGIGKRTNELDRVYSIAASWLDVMRTVTPQLMFGRADGKASAWAVTARKARFSVGHHYECPQVVVMEVTIGMHADDALPMNERPLPEQLELLNAAQNVVVTEVNRAGGIVLGTRGNISMVALWNTTWTANNAAVLALRTAYTIHYCLQQVRGLPASVICLATGPFVVGKIAAGERRYACALSTTLSYLRVMKNVGSSMGCAIVMDRSTSRRLPLVVSRQLKPVVVLRLSSCEGGKNYVVYSCNDKAMKNPEQAAHYIRGFLLYQNNLLNEAVMEFERYLSLYPSDPSALWLYELVLKPRFTMSLIATKESTPMPEGFVAQTNGMLENSVF